MSPFDKLINHFEKFPGVGVRQAKRFTFHLLTLPKEQKEELANLITTLDNSVTECAFCHRFFPTNNHPENKVCDICLDNNRDARKLLVIASDNDIFAIEKSHFYNGLYFVLGGTVPLLNTRNKNGTEQKIRAGSLKALVTERSKAEILEVILGFSVNPDGENTCRFIESVLSDLVTAEKVKISFLGRGLSTGSELEYADAETIKNALRNRV